jgi:mono/diheme cytochrome c family protein
MKRSVIPFALGALLLCFTPPPAFAASATNDTLTIVVGDKTSTFSLADLEKKLGPVTVTIDDPVYHAKKTFEGFDLLSVLALAGLDPKSAQDEIVFTAKDGYAPNTAFEKLRAHHAVLAFREHGAGKVRFGKINQGKAKLDPGPYYVVWEEGKALGDEVPWPYQLVKIEAVSFAEKFEKLYPDNVKSDSGAMAGFMTFKSDCIRCHSVNLQGGNVGPELNSPKSVTEYWDIATLKSFIHDPNAFRYKSKMPGFPQLKPADIDHIVDYFTAMKAKKVTL